MNRELIDYIYQQKTTGGKNYLDNYFLAKAEIDKKKIRKWEEQKHLLLDDENQNYTLYSEDALDDRDVNSIRPPSKQEE